MATSTDDDLMKKYQDAFTCEGRLEDLHLWRYVGPVTQWLERATDNRVVAGSNPAEAV